MVRTSCLTKRASRPTTDRMNLERQTLKLSRQSRASLNQLRLRRCLRLNRYQRHSLPHERE